MLFIDKLGITIKKLLFALLVTSITLIIVVNIPPILGWITTFPIVLIIMVILPIIYSIVLSYTDPLIPFSLIRILFAKFTAGISEFIVMFMPNPLNKIDKLSY